MSDHVIDGSRGPHVRIRLDGNGRGSTEINGVDLSSVIHSMKLTTKAGEPSYLELVDDKIVASFPGCQVKAIVRSDDPPPAMPTQSNCFALRAAQAPAPPTDKSNAGGIPILIGGKVLTDSKTLAEIVVRELPGVLAKKGLT